ncbi:unnamed protein product [Mucor hiemalis]
MHLSMNSINIEELDNERTNELLGKLDEWRFAICPDGTLATQPCFVLKQRPSIIIHPDQPLMSPQQQHITTELITERTWSDNLVECGAITHLNDDILLKTLSEFYMIFHSSDKIMNRNTLHSLKLLKHASFKVDNILRPTRILQNKLDQLSMISDLNAKWEHLLNIWNTFGYLWPRKIVLGYKTHMKQTYKFVDNVDSMNGYYYNLNKFGEKFHQQSEHDQLFDLKSFLNNGTIVARIDIAPIQDFLHQDPSFDGENHDYLVRAVSADPPELKRSPESQYIWRFTWTPTAATQPNDMPYTLEHRSQTVRGCNKVYIYPACKSASPKGKKSASPKSSQPWHINDRITDTENLIDTHKMVLSCRPYQYEAKKTHPEFSKLRVLRLLSTGSPQYLNEKIDWTIEYPDNGLKYMTDAQANIKLNFHEHVRRMKPLLSGDIIQLQQIGLLTAFTQVEKLSNSLQQKDAEANSSQQRPNHLQQQQPSSSQSLRTTRKIITRKPTTNSKNKKNVLCVDEDITVERWRENTLWRIELATKEDIDKHSSNFIRWPQQAHGDNTYDYPKEYNEFFSQDVKKYFSPQLDKETGSFISTASSLRRTKSLGSLHESVNVSIHARDDSDKAPYFEDLVVTKSRSRILAQIAKVSIQPLAQLVKPSKLKQQKHLSPPPFTSYSTS